MKNIHISIILCILSTIFCTNTYASEFFVDENHSLVVSLTIIIVLQVFLFFVYLVKRPYKTVKTYKRDTSKPHIKYQEPELLEKTKQHLYREIARHESTEELLRETQDYLQCILNSMPFNLISITKDGYVTHWNLETEKTTGLKAEEAIGSHIQQAYASLPINLDNIDNSIKTGIPIARETHQLGRGSNATFLDITIYPLFTHDVSGAVILAEDTTHKVRMENMVIQNEKMMSLGELAAGMAHEINNPLAGILNNAQNIIRRTQPDLPANQAAANDIGIDLNDLHHYLETRKVLSFIDSIREAGERAAKIVKNMLEFSRGSNRNHVYTDMRQLVNHSLDLAANSLELKTESGIELPKMNYTFDDNLPLVPCAPIEIQQVILNLLRNAVQAFQSDEYGPPLDPEVNINIHATSETLILEISDNGPGMVETIRKHIFEPFYTTKDIGKGTGLGLSVSYFIITEHHNGSIEVDSKPGEGTTFIIKLPLERQLPMETQS